MPSTPQHPAPEPSPHAAGDTASCPEPAPPQPGRNRGRAKLTDDEVRTIRADYAMGRWLRADLAYIYGVSIGTIGNVVHRVTYTHVTGDPTETPSGEQD